MSRITDLEQKAQALHRRLQQDTEKKLEDGMRQIFSDTESILRERLSIISGSIEQGAESLKQQQSKATAEITQQIQDSVKTVKKAQDTTLQAVLTDQRRALESLQAKLQESTRLSEEIAKQSNLKTALISSNIVLISLAIISFISVIWMTYAGTSKYSEIQAKEARLQQIERVTEEKILEYRKLLNDIYEIKSSKGKK